MEITGHDHEIEDVGYYKNKIELYMKENGVSRVRGNSGFSIANDLKRGRY